MPLLFVVTNDSASVARAAQPLGHHDDRRSTSVRGPRPLRDRLVAVRARQGGVPARSRGMASLTPSKLVYGRAVLGRGCDPARAALAQKAWSPLLRADVFCATSDEELLAHLTQEWPWLD